MPLPTLLDIAKLNGTDGLVGLIDETSRAYPEVRLGGARTIKGISFETLIRTKLPTVGFRNFNEGGVLGKGEYQNRLVKAFPFNPRWECDRMVADSYEDGPMAFIALEADGMMQASFQHISAQFYYGNLSTGNDVKGFPGLGQMHDATNMVVDATGSTVNGCSSVWAVRFGPKDVQWVWGNGGNLGLSDLDDNARLTDDNGKAFTGYMQEIRAFCGLQVGSLRSVAKIKNITAQSGKTLTDAMLGALLTKFPVGLPPTMFLMGKRALEQLRASRTAVNPTGAEAPTPTEYMGIPIQPTESLVDTEAVS